MKHAHPVVRLFPLILLFAATTAGARTVPFGPVEMLQDSVGNPYWAVSLIAADFDRDGDIDLVGTAASAGSVYRRLMWLENQFGDGRHWVSHVIDSHDIVVDEAGIGDFEADGDPDLFGRENLTNNIYCWINPGITGQPWTRVLINNTLPGNEYLSFGDINGDGATDMICTEDGAASIYDNVLWFENSRSTTAAWTRHVVTNELSRPRTPLVGNIDADGDIDIVAIGPMGCLYWFRNDGASWTRMTIDDQNADYKNTYYDLYSLLDFDKDGDADVVALTWDVVNNVYNTKLLLNGGNGNVWSKQSLPSGPARPFDLDVDGDLDILHFPGYQTVIRVSENLGPGFSNWNTYTVDPDTKQEMGDVKPVDLDGDGQPELVGAPGAKLGIWRNQTLSVRSITPSSNSSIIGPSTAFDIEFSVAPAGIDASDLVLSGLAASGAHVGTPVKLFDRCWRFPVTHLAAGELRVRLASTPGAITDGHGQNLIPPADPWIYQVAASDPPPRVTAFAPATSVTLNQPSFELMVTFSEPIAALTREDLDVRGPAAARATIENPVRVTGTEWHVTLKNLENGPLIVDIGALTGSIRDLTGNEQSPRPARWTANVQISEAWEELAGSGTGLGLSHTAASSWRPAITTDPSGNPVVAWAAEGIYCRRWNGSIFVGFDGQINGGKLPMTTDSVNQPAIASNTKGHIVVAWEGITDESTQRRDIYLLFWNGSAWVELGGSGSGSGVSNTGIAWRPAVALDSNDNVHLAWDNGAGSNSHDIYYKRWTGTGWIQYKNSASGAGVLAGDSNQLRPSIAVDNNNMPVIACEATASGYSAIYLVRWYPSSNAWISVDGLPYHGNVSDTGGYATHASVKIGADGWPWVAWSQNVAGNYEIYLRRFYLNGSWVAVGGSASGGGISNNATLSAAPSLAIDAAGFPTVAWSDQQIYVRRWNGVAWQELGGSASGGGVSNMGGSSSNSRVALNPRGLPVVVWDNDANPPLQIYLRRWTGPAFIPMVQSITCLDEQTTNATTVRFAVAFTTPVFNVTKDDFELTSSSLAGSTITGVATSGNISTVTVNTGSGVGTIQLELLDRGTIHDAANTKLAGLNGKPYRSEQIYHIDNVPPRLLSILRANPDPACAEIVEFVATFSEPVSHVDARDFGVTATGLPAAHIIALRQNGTEYLVSVLTGPGDGTLRLDLVDDDSIRDSHANPLGGPGLVNGDRTGDESYTIDHTPPRVLSIVPDSPNPSNGPAVVFKVTFSEDVFYPANDDFYITSDSLTGASIASVNRSANLAYVTVNTGTKVGQLRIALRDDNSVRDKTGNPLGGPAIGDGNFISQPITIVDTVPPRVSSISCQNFSPTNAQRLTFDVAFSENISGIGVDDFVTSATGLGNSWIVRVTGTGASYQVEVDRGLGQGRIQLRLRDNDSIRDACNNALAGASSADGSAISPVIVIKYDVWVELGGSATGTGISGNANAIQKPALAVTPDGQVFVAWSNSNPKGLLVKRWYQGQWKDCQTGLTNTYYLTRSNLPAFAVGKSGRPVLTWMGYDDREQIDFVYAARWNGSRWLDVNGSTVLTRLGFDSTPAVAVDANDRPAIAWKLYSTIKLLKWDGKKWADLGGSSGSSGMANCSGGSGAPAVAMDASGRPYVFWQQKAVIAGTSYYRIYGRHWNGTLWEQMAGSAEGSGLSISNPVDEPPCVAADASSTVTVSWVGKTYGKTDYHVNLKKWNGSVWQSYPSIPLAAIAQHALCLTKSGNPVVAYACGGTLFVVRWDGKQWVGYGGSEASPGIAAGSVYLPNLALNPSDIPYVAWNTSNNLGSICLKYWWNERFSTRVRNHLLKCSTLTGADLTAADANLDKKVDVADVVTLIKQGK